MKTCIVCGKSFAPESPDQDACSRRCVRIFVIRHGARLARSRRPLQWNDAPSSECEGAYLRSE